MSDEATRNSRMGSLAFAWDFLTTTKKDRSTITMAEVLAAASQVDEFLDNPRSTKPEIRREAIRADTVIGQAAHPVTDPQGFLVERKPPIDCV